MHIDHPVESFEKNVLDLDLLADTGVVHQNVDLAERGLRVDKKAARRRRIGDVAMVGEGALAELLNVRHDAGGTRLVIDMTKRDIGALFCEGVSDRRADATACAGDESLFAGELGRS